MKNGDGIGPHDSTESRRQSLELLGGAAVVSKLGGRVDREIGGDGCQRAVAGGGGTVGVALVGTFGLAAAHRDD